MTTTSESTAPPQEHPRVDPPPSAHWRSILIGFGVAVAITVVFWFVPHPEALSDQAWRTFGLFVATIVCIIIAPMPMGAVTIIGMVAAVLLDLVPLSPSDDDPEAPYALMGFSNATIWLIVMAFLLSRGFIKTGFGRRIALYFVSKVGGRMLGVGYGLSLADLVMSPAIPSATARGGGIMAPIMTSVAHTYDSEPGPTARRAGSFLALVASNSNSITCAIFLTAMAGNPLIASLASQQGVEISWATWALGAIVPGLVALIAIPALIYVIYPPELKKTPKVKQMASEELDALGPMTYGEKVLGATFIVLLLLWTVGDLVLGISATTTAFIGVIILMLFDVLTWEDIIREKSAWDTMTWFAVLYMMATALSSYGFIDWISDLIAGSLGSMGWMPALILLVVIYFFTHYFFASATAHISAMYIAFLGAALSLGAPPLLAALILGYCSNIFQSLTHYSGGASPTLFGTKYNTAAQWWGVGLVAGVASLAIWIFVGGAWMGLVGIW
jgi:DASS family divalent anion:Na+ symporter